ncbi:transketolase family protein [Polynucleobacter sp. MWH-UH35A]|uniref:transketolase family protein n=1 Tax=Polynucleobacter sp. MWH-UH35A TaxID=1855619 RepID=UPI001BFDA5B4|nr:transketolase [Polynucleobacter sp. MWH-UH35A]QWD60429.1 transketolase [Polynucleobacter sp. MWH-UH35A]
MRNAFIEELVELAKTNSNIVLMVGDLGFSVVEPFQDAYPDRFFNAGVAEQNMMSMAAGLASEGCHAFVYSIANFPTFRCAEQIRNDVAYHQLPVTIVAVGGGLAYGNLGYSHHAVQDYALMRSMPNMLISAPGDPMEVRACLRYLTSHPQPSYLRLGKAGELCLHDSVPSIEPGIWQRITNSSGPKNRAILATGNGLQIAKNWQQGGQYLDHDLYSLPLWGITQKNLQTNQVEKFEKLVTVEDHLLDAGFGSWMLESLINEPKLIERLALKALDPSVCGLVASQNELHKASNLE